MTTSRRGVIERFRDHLPVSDQTPVVTLGEGDTPLVFSEALSRDVGTEVWLKYEGLNPTGSFKDRGMTVAISMAVQRGAKAVACASTGNTSASAAAYAARAGIVCGVLVPEGGVAVGKLAQALVHGARLLQIPGSFDRALDLSKQLGDLEDVTLVNSINPHRIEGQKTAAFEVVQALGRAPDVHVMPVGNAGNITAYWKGYREAKDAGWCDHLPRMHGFQATGADPIVKGRAIAEPRTVASAIRIGNPASWDGAIEAADHSGGAISSVDDEAITRAYRGLAHEGLFVEMASAASVAGLHQLTGRGLIERDSLVVCVLTGHGLKDPGAAMSDLPEPATIPAEIDAVVAALDLA